MKSTRTPTSVLIWSFVSYLCFPNNIFKVHTFSLHIFKLFFFSKSLTLRHNTIFLSCGINIFFLGAYIFAFNCKNSDIKKDLN